MPAKSESLLHSGITSKIYSYIHGWGPDYQSAISKTILPQENKRRASQISQNMKKLLEAGIVTKEPQFEKNNPLVKKLQELASLHRQGLGMQAELTGSPLGISELESLVYSGWHTLAALTPESVLTAMIRLSPKYFKWHYYQYLAETCELVMKHILSKRSIS